MLIITPKNKVLLKNSYFYIDVKIQAGKRKTKKVIENNLSYINIFNLLCSIHSDKIHFCVYLSIQIT